WVGVTHLPTRRTTPGAPGEAGRVLVTPAPRRRATGRATARGCGTPQSVSLTGGNSGKRGDRTRQNGRYEGETGGHDGGRGRGERVRDCGSVGADAGR